MKLTYGEHAIGIKPVLVLGDSAGRSLRLIPPGNKKRTTLGKDWFICVALLAFKPAAALESNRVLLTSITTSNINAAVDAWLSDSTSASANYGNISVWDTSGVTSLAYTFHGHPAFNQDIGGWDTGAVTTLRDTFNGATAFNQDIGEWDTSAVRTLHGTFWGALDFNQDIGGWDTGAVTTLAYTFGGATAFDRDIGRWDTGAVTTLYYTFRGATAFNQDIGEWDTSAVRTLLESFAYASAFDQSISGWDTGAVRTLHGTFWGALDFNQDIGGWDTGAVTTLAYTFGGATAFDRDIGGWDTGAVTSLYESFYGATAFNQDIGGWDTGAVKTLFQTFYGATAFDQDISGWSTGAVTSMKFTFNSATAFNQDIGRWNTGAVTTMAFMFSGASDFSQILCWNTTDKETTDMFTRSSGSANPNAAKCACTANQFYDGLNCESCPAGQGSNGKTESCYILPTPEPTQAPSSPSSPPSALPAAGFTVDPLVTGGISIFLVAVAILTCRTLFKKCKAARNDGGNENKTSTVTDSTSITSGLIDASVVEIGQDVEFADEEAARPPTKKSSESLVQGELETLAQKHAAEFERFKISAEAKMKIRERKISRQEQAKSEALAQDNEDLQAKVAELTEIVSRQQGNSKPSTDAVSEDNNFQLPQCSPRDKSATTAIPTELLKGLLKDSAAPGSKEGNAASDNDPRARVIRASKSVGGAGNVRVAVRVRPPNQRELAGEGNGVCVDVVPADGIVKVGSDKAFTFDVAFSMEATQAQVFDKLGVDLVGWVLGGYNASVFAYGQTSSGKTHSMMGARDSEGLRGLIPRIISLLWECVQAFLNENSKHDCVLKASYLEIYNEEIRDLLGNCEKLKLRNDPKKGIFASGLTMVPLQSGEEAMECIERGARLRSVAATKYNSESSRSHAVFEIHISKTYPTDSGDMVSTSRLSLTDLAGSERSSKVGTSGTSLQEGNNINKSLSTLGRCISVLVDISQGKKCLAPFRDSVLTLYLRDALAGNVLTTMLANVSPVSSNMDETVSTLRFAASAKRIKTKVTKNEDLQQKRIRELTEELEAVKKEMAMHIRLAEGAKKLVFHLNGGELPDTPLSEDDEDEPAGAGKATIAILRSAIAERRGSTRDAPLFEAYEDDEADGVGSVLTASDEAPPSSHSQMHLRNVSSRQYPQSTPASLSWNQSRKTPSRQRPRLAARKAAMEEKEGHHVTL